ncbi:hypothetical protein BGW37DRAFT_301982 [Umbelopsis sp. PMI_123]|nr:hypothetical protein BGW37DRAFT_301982 [Umbelopsis sp. PMI_123]
MPTTDTTSHRDTKDSAQVKHSLSTSSSATIPSPSTGSPTDSIEQSTHMKANKHQTEEDTNSDTDNKAKMSKAVRKGDSQSGNTNDEYEVTSIQSDSLHNAASDSDGEFESAEDDSNENTNDESSDSDVEYEQCKDEIDTNATAISGDHTVTEAYERSSTEATGDVLSSVSSMCEPLNESEYGISDESETSVSSSMSSPTEPYKTLSNKDLDFDNDDNMLGENWNADTRARKTASLPPFQMVPSRVSLEGMSLPSECRKQRLKEDSRKLKNFSKHFSFPINPFSRTASPVSPGTVSPHPLSRTLHERFNQLSFDKKKARESITSIVSLKEKLAQTGKSSEEQQNIVREELDKLKHEIDVEQDDEPNWGKLGLFK